VLSSVFTRCILHPVELCGSTLGKALRAFFSEIPLQWQPAVMLVGTATALLLVLTATRYRLVIPMLLRLEPRTPVLTVSDTGDRHGDCQRRERGTCSGATGSASYIESPHDVHLQKYRYHNLQRGSRNLVHNLCDEKNSKYSGKEPNWENCGPEFSPTQNSCSVTHHNCRQSNDGEQNEIQPTPVVESLANEQFGRKSIPTSVEKCQNQRPSRLLRLFREDNSQETVDSTDSIGFKRNNLQRVLKTSSETVNSGRTRTQKRSTTSQFSKAPDGLLNDEKENSCKIPCATGKSTLKKSVRSRRRKGKGKTEDSLWSVDAEVISDSD
ncbi:hypothetical protein EGW08_020983, partial [Elysia chlorotica]